MISNVEPLTGETVNYKAKNGTNIELYRSKSHEIFSGSILHDGNRFVVFIGYSNCKLWFHRDGDHGASYWDDVCCFEQMLEKGFSLFSDFRDEDDVPEESVTFDWVLSQGERSLDLKKIYSLKMIMDVTVLVGPNKVPIKAHKCILMIRSDFFKNLFLCPLSENVSGIIHLKELSPEIFSQILEYMYLGRVRTCDPIALLYAANFLQYQELFRDITQKIEQHIWISNVIQFLKISLDLKNHKLEELCLKFIDSYARVLLVNPKHYMLLSKEEWFLILKRDSLEGISEYQLFNSFCAWSLANTKCFDHHLQNLQFTSKFIHFEWMTLAEIKTMPHLFLPIKLEILLEMRKQNQELGDDDTKYRKPVKKLPKWKPKNMSQLKNKSPSK